MQAFESMFSGIKSKSEALEQANRQLREAICLPDLQVLFDLCSCIHVFVCVCMFISYSLYTTIVRKVKNNLMNNIIV